MLLKLPILLSLTSSAIWAVIPFRQYGKKYFYYFYFITLGNLLILYLRWLFHSGSNFFYVPGNFLALVFVQDVSLIKKYKFGLLIILAILSLLYFKIDTNETFILLSIIQSMILLTLLKLLIKTLINRQVIDLFLSVMILDVIITILVQLGIIHGATNNYYYFYVSVTFDSLVSLFFWIKADNPILLIKLSTN